jgi:hypothetical protein
VNRSTWEGMPLFRTMAVVFPLFAAYVFTLGASAVCALHPLLKNIWICHRLRTRAVHFRTRAVHFRTRVVHFRTRVIHFRTRTPDHGAAMRPTATAKHIIFDQTYLWKSIRLPCRPHRYPQPKSGSYLLGWRHPRCRTFRACPAILKSRVGRALLYI